MRLTRAPLVQTAFRQLDARLERGTSRPVALALSGGGDSIALLRIAADWTRANGRRLLALTVDHGLNPDSGRWADMAERAARAAGADWRGLVWTGDKPATGLAAAARRARHALIAEAARQAGARVVLFGHTLDDVLEGEAMRAEGVPLGRLRPWAPSPAWPQGRGLMLARPLLEVRRAALRDWLAGQGADWIDDPANLDPGQLRARVRAEGVEDQVPPGQDARSLQAARSLPAGALGLPLDTSAQSLALALVCAGGGDRMPRGPSLAALHGRLTGGEAGRRGGVLAGARAQALDDMILVSREPGEWRRKGLAPLELAAGVGAVWDGRCEITARSPGWRVVPAAGLMAALSRSDRAALNRLPAMLRPICPVMMSSDGGGPVLAEREAEVRWLVPERYRLAAGETPHEAALAASSDGETVETDLCLFGDGPRAV